MTIMKIAHIAHVMSPFHTHDDYADCVFLGQRARTTPSYAKWDFWLANEEGEEVMLVRFGSQARDVSSYPVSVDWMGMGFSEDHAVADAFALYHQYQRGKWTALEVTPHSERKDEEEESDWRVGYECVVGLYHDIWVKETDRTIFLRDSAGEPLGIAKKNAVAGRNSDSREHDGFLFRAEGSLDGVEAGYLDKVLGTKKQVFLWAMLLKQMSADSGQ